MFEGEEVVDTGAGTEASPEPSESTSTSAAPAKAEGSETKTNDTQDNVPFHKHPRWVERDNELKSEREARQRLERNYQEMERRLQDMAKPREPVVDKRSAMIERLKGIDPEFAEFVSGLAPTEEVKALREWKQQAEQQAERTRAYGELDRLHALHKVDGPLKDRYRLAIEAEVRANPHMTLSELPQIYKKVHDDYSAWIDGIKREANESYLKAKKTDSSVPGSQPKGTPVAAGKKSEWSKDPEVARSQLVQRVMQKRKAGQDL